MSLNTPLRLCRNATAQSHRSCAINCRSFQRSIPSTRRCSQAPFSTAAPLSQEAIEQSHSLPEAGEQAHEGTADRSLSVAEERIPGFREPGYDPNLRLPRSVQAIYLKPLRREAQYGVPSCDLQMRSYSVRNLEFFADFALRAAYYLNLPAYGPIPLPRITQRWTVPRSNFIFKKSQENFERITLRRLIQIKDGHPDTVELWLSFLKKHAYYGIGMKANIWDYNELGVGKTMDVDLQNIKSMMEPKWAHFGRKNTFETSERVMELMNSEKFKLGAGQSAPMMGNARPALKRKKPEKKPETLEGQQAARVEKSQES